MLTAIGSFFTSNFFDDYFKDMFLVLLLVIYVVVFALTAPPRREKVVTEGSPRSG